MTLYHISESAAQNLHILRSDLEHFRLPKKEFTEKQFQSKEKMKARVIYSSQK